jgi:hypothetical protein
VGSAEGACQLTPELSASAGDRDFGM